MKAKILLRFYDKVEGKYYEPSAEFVELPDHVIKRLKELGVMVAEIEKEKVNDKPTSAKKPTDKQPKK